MDDSELYLLMLKIIGFLIGWSMIFTIPWIRFFVRMFKYGMHNGKHSEESEGIRNG